MKCPSDDLEGRGHGGMQVGGAVGAAERGFLAVLHVHAVLLEALAAAMVA